MSFPARLGSALSVCDLPATCVRPLVGVLRSTDNPRLRTPLSPLSLVERRISHLMAFSRLPRFLSGRKLFRKPLVVVVVAFSSLLSESTSLDTSTLVAELMFGRARPRLPEGDGFYLRKAYPVTSILDVDCLCVST